MLLVLYVFTSAVAGTTVLSGVISLLLLGFSDNKSIYPFSSSLLLFLYTGACHGSNIGSFPASSPCSKCEPTPGKNSVARQ